jgi:hypothetical protein
LSSGDIQGLYNKSLIYITLPLSVQDTAQLLPLDSFVMNGTGGDSLEGLCYKSFISFDESTTVLQLSGMLLKVLSLFIRLNLAEKVTIDSGEPTAKCMVAVYDCNLAATLMLGNINQTVKSFAVTLFEVGKMPNTGVMEFTTALQMVEAPTDESMKVCHEKSQIITRSLFFLRSLPISSGGVDMIRIENLFDLDDSNGAKMFDRNYAAAYADTHVAVDGERDLLRAAIAPLPLAVAAAVPAHARPGQPASVPVAAVGDCEVAARAVLRLRHRSGLKWEAELIVVSTITLLITLDDALPSSPVFVQCSSSAGRRRGRRSARLGSHPTISASRSSRRHSCSDPYSDT